MERLEQLPLQLVELLIRLPLMLEEHLTRGPLQLKERLTKLPLHLVGHWPADAVQLCDLLTRFAAQLMRCLMGFASLLMTALTMAPGGMLLALLPECCLPQAPSLPEMTALALVRLREPPAKVPVHPQLSAVLALERLMCCALPAVLQPAFPAWG